MVLDIEVVERPVLLTEVFLPRTIRIHRYRTKWTAFESFINVLELKKRLIEKDKIDMKRDFRFTLTDESGANGRLERESK